MNEKLKSRRYLDSLADALGSSEGQSAEEIKGEMEEMGVDVQVTMDWLSQSVDEICNAAKRKVLDIAKGKRERERGLMESVKGKFKDLGHSELIERIKSLREMMQGHVQLAYRDLDRKDDEELRTMLEDLELAHSMNQKDAPSEK